MRGEARLTASTRGATISSSLLKPKVVYTGALAIKVGRTGATAGATTSGCGAKVAGRTGWIGVVRRGVKGGGATGTKDEG